MAIHEFASSQSFDEKDPPEDTSDPLFLDPAVLEALTSKTDDNICLFEDVLSFQFLEWEWEERKCDKGNQPYFWSNYQSTDKSKAILFAKWKMEDWRDSIFFFVSGQITQDEGSGVLDVTSGHNPEGETPKKNHECCFQQKSKIGFSIHFVQLNDLPGCSCFFVCYSVSVLHFLSSF